MGSKNSKMSHSNAVCASGSDREACSATQGVTGDDNIWPTSPKSTPTQEAGRDELLDNEELLKENVKKLNGPKLKKRLDALFVLNGKLNSIGPSAIEIVINAGAVTRCVELMKAEISTKKKDETQTEYEERKDLEENCQYLSAHLLYIVTNGSQEQAKVVADEEGAVEAFIEFLPLTDRLADVSLCSLGNIICAVPTVRNSEICNVIISTLIDLIRPGTRVPFLTSIGYFIAKLCQSLKPFPPKDTMMLSLRAITKLIIKSNNNSVGKACTALLDWCRLSMEIFERTVEEISKSGLVEKLVNLLECEMKEVIILCLGSLIHFVSKSELLARHSVNAGVLPALFNPLISEDKKIVELSTKTLLSILLQPVSVVSQIVHTGLVGLLANVVNGENLVAQENAVHALMCISLHDENMYVYLCGPKAISAMCRMLKQKDSKHVSTVLEAVTATLMYATKHGHAENVIRAIKDAGGPKFDISEELRNKMQQGEILELCLNVTDMRFRK